MKKLLIALLLLGPLFAGAQISDRPFVDSPSSIIRNSSSGAEGMYQMNIAPLEDGIELTADGAIVFTGHAYFIRCKKCQMMLYIPCKMKIILGKPAQYLTLDNKPLMRNAFRKGKVLEFIPQFDESKRISLK